MESPDILAVKGLGQFQQFKIASEFRRLIENWHLSDFHVQAARPDQEISAATHLSTRGDNIASFARYMHEEHSERFHDVLKKLASRVPGIQTVSSQDTADGRIVLRFADGSFKDPFLARYVSDGTIRMFAYLLLLNDPSPHPLLCVEEPENQLYPELLEGLAEEFREYAEGGGQVFVSTHSPDFLDALRPSEVYLIKKDGGASTAIPIAQSASVNELVGLGDRLGSLLRQNALWELANR